MTSVHPHCRLCGMELSRTFVDFGRMPRANGFLRQDDLGDAENTYPLHAKVCSQCLLVQIDAVVPPEQLFSEYAYFSSYSSTWLEHARRFADESTNRFGLRRDSFVVEVASNDGYLLRYFKDLGIPVLGIEPARNVAEVALGLGIPTETEFFGESYAAELVARRGQPDLVVGINVLAHVPDLNDFVAGLSLLLKPTSVLVLEFPHLLKLIEGVQFDTIYDEHFSYFSLLTVEKILGLHGLGVFDVQRLRTHGGSLRVYARPIDSENREISPSVAGVRLLEAEAGLDRLETYENFAGAVVIAQQHLRDFLFAARSDGNTVVAYGAAAKGNTLLNSCAVTPDLISYAVDRNPFKQGLLLPGSRIPIFDPCKVFETRPDFLLLLPWNLADEIVDQMADVRSWGCRFVVPIPAVKVLE